MGEEEQITFGPVPSRRLGHSLGINNIPYKICTYSCVYCQVGRTQNWRIQPEEFYQPKSIAEQVSDRIREADARDEPVDYLTFVPDGEPTLDVNLREEIDLLKPLDRRIAVITNGSLLWKPDVREALQNADWISVKIDTVDPDIWRKMNRAHRRLTLEEVLEGILEFSSSFKGVLTTETMLVHWTNDSPDDLEKTAEFVARVRPHKSYLAVPIRPPAEKWVRPASAYKIALSYAIFSEQPLEMEYLIGYEGNAFAFTGNAENDLLSITAVHPMREDAVREYLQRAKADWESVEALLEEQKLVVTTYNSWRFFSRNFTASTY